MASISGSARAPHTFRRAWRSRASWPLFSALRVSRCDRHDLRALATLHSWDNLSDGDLRNAKDPHLTFGFIVFAKSF